MSFFSAVLAKVYSSVVPRYVRGQLINFWNLSLRYGQYETIKKWRCLDKNGEVIPWYTYPAIEFLTNLDFSGKSVFEFGSGDSSEFWVKAGAQVVAVESDRDWYKKISERQLDGLSLEWVDECPQYENSILETGRFFDIIVIDGKRRFECASMVKKCLNLSSEEGCMIILDNSDWYRETAKYLRKNLDFIQIDFHGFGPISLSSWTTSLFLSRNFSFPASGQHQPHFSWAANEWAEGIRQDD